MYNSWYLLRRAFGYRDDYDVCIFKTKARAAKNRKKQGQMNEVRPEDEDESILNSMKNVTKEQFVDKANAATNADAKMRRTFSLGQLLLFEDLPMAVLNGMLIAEELKQVECGTSSSDTVPFELIIVLISFTFSACLLCLKFAKFSAISGQRKRAQVLQAEAEAMMGHLQGEA